MAKRDYRLILLLGVAGLGLSMPAVAQQAPAGNTISVGAQSLSGAIAELSARSGTRIALADGVAGSVRVNGASAASLPDALNQMLAGTGLSWRPSGDAIEIAGSTAVGGTGEHVLGAVRVEGTQSSGNGAFADLAGFGAGVGANGSSDTTATEGTGSLTGNGARVASKTAATLRETPFTVNVVTSEQFKQQNLSDILGALNSSPGITVPDAGNSSVIISRGFQITTFQVDGGPPQQFAQNGATFLFQPDLSAYDHIEVVRGSNGLYGGTSDPSGTVNLQRKRPLDHQQVELDVRGGQWNDFRGELDVSSPVAFDGKLRARGVAAYETKDFFYDYANFKRLSLYGILEGDLGPDTILRGGLRYQRQRERGQNTLGVVFFEDGTDLNLPRSTNITSNYAFNRPEEFEQFLQLDHRFGGGWTFNFNASHIRRAFDKAEPTINGSIAPDRTGLYNNGAETNRDAENEIAIGATVTGTFKFMDRDQKIVVGADYNRSNDRSAQAFYSIDPVNLDVDNFNPDDIGPFPSGDPFITANSTGLLSQYAVYGSLILEPIRHFHLTGGARVSWVKNRKDSAVVVSGVAQPATSASATYNGNVTPSVGATYDLNTVFSLYASYAKTFNAYNIYTAADGSLLPPLNGRSFEGGIKAAPAGGKLNASLAYFDTIQNNQPLFASSNEALQSCCYVAAGEIRSRGVDLQVSGALTPNWQVNAGYSYTKVDYNDAYLVANLNSTFAFAQGQTPEHQVKIFTAYTLPGRFNKVTVSGNFLLESARGSFGRSCASPDPLTGVCLTAVTPFSFSQPLYAIGDLRAAYRFSKHWEVAASLTNITDTRYFATIRDPSFSNFYGEPRKVTISARVVY